MELNEALAPVIGDEDCVVYSVQCESISGWRGALSYLGALLWLPILDPAIWSGTWYLVASTTRGTLARVNRQQRLEEIINVGDWNPAWKDLFQRVEIGDRAFTYVERIAGRNGVLPIKQTKR